MHCRRHHSRVVPSIVCAVAALAVLVAFPQPAARLIVALLALTAALVAALTILKGLAFLPSRRRRQAREVHLPAEPPFVSIHVAAGEASDEQIVRTLESIVRQNYPAGRFEAILLGPCDPATARRCAELGVRHHPAAAGSPADLLNTARRLMSTDATHIALVGPGVELAPYFLRVAAAAFDSRDISHVQFPHAFRRPHGATLPVEQELRHFFELYAASAGTGALPAGQLCVVRRDALSEVGGWSDDSANHGAELGTRLLAAGFHGRYVELDVAKRDLPHTFEELAAQRVRLAAGHARCLVEACRSGRVPRTGLGNFWRMLQQLGAWLDVQLVVLAAALFAAAGILFTGHASFQQVFALALGLWAFAALAGALPVAAAVKGGAGDRLRAAFVHQALAPAASWGTLLGLFRPQPQLEAGPVPQPARPAALADTISPLLGVMFLLPSDRIFPLLALAAVLFLHVSLRRYVAAALATPGAPVLRTFTPARPAARAVAGSR